MYSTTIMQSHKTVGLFGMGDGITFKITAVAQTGIKHPVVTSKCITCYVTNRSINTCQHHICLPWQVHGKSTLTDKKYVRKSEIFKRAKQSKMCGTTCQSDPKGVHFQCRRTLFLYIPLKICADILPLKQSRQCRSLCPAQVS